MDDRLDGIATFVQVVEAGSFAVAGERMNLTRSAVGKVIARLEKRLGVRLIQRTTRSQNLTEDGQAYYDSCVRALAELDAAEAMLEGGRQQPRGRLRVSVPIAFGHLCVAPVLLELARRNPALRIDISFTDRVVDLIEEGFDLAVRISRLENSSLIARRLSPFSVRVCGSPELIEKVGMPVHPRDIGRAPCIIDTNGRWLANWPFKGDDDDTTSVAVSGPIEVNSPMVARAAAVSGLGFAVLPDFIAAPDIMSGRLVSVLDDRILQGGGIFAVYPHRRYLPAKVRVFVDFLVQWFKAREAA